MNTFILYKDRLVYKGGILSDKAHKHHFIEILFSNNKLDFEINNKKITARCLLINSNIKHRCLSKNEQICTINIDPESKTGCMLKNRCLLNKPYVQIKQIKHTNIELFIKKFNSIFDSSFDENLLSPVVKKVIKYLNDNISGKIYISDISAQVYYSESRLQHIFAEQMNTPIINYLQMLRVKKTIHMLQKGETLSECVFCCGFTDYSHLNRVFKSMFGVSPSFIKKYAVIMHPDNS